MIDRIKITLLVCLTCLLGYILAVSFNEYVNRYTIITTNNNSVYIFDKKSAVLNRCDNDQCHVINTKFPQTQLWQTLSGNTKMESIPPQYLNRNINNNTPQAGNNTPQAGNYASNPIVTPETPKTNSQEQAVQQNTQQSSEQG